MKHSLLTASCTVFGLALLQAACGTDGGNDDDASVQDIDTADSEQDTDANDSTPDADDIDTTELPETDAADTSDADADTTDTPDVSPPTEWPEIPRTETGAGAGPDGFDPEQPLPAGMSTVGRVRNRVQLFEGAEARCRADDYIIRNELIRACIAGNRPIDQYLLSGGHIVDLERLDQPGGEKFHLTVPSTFLLAASADTIEVVNDGSNGEAAVLRTRGVELTPKILAGFVGNIFAYKYLIFETEYRLEPGKPYLEAVTWISLDTEAQAATVTPIEVGDLVVPGTTATAWMPGFGYAAPVAKSPLELFVGSTPHRSYGVFSETLALSPFDIPLIKVRFYPLVHTSGRLAAGAEATYRRYFAVGDGSSNSIREAFADFRPLSGNTVTLSRSFSALQEDRRFEIRDSDGSVELVVFDDSGIAEVRLADGDYTIAPFDANLGAEETFTVAGDSQVTLTAAEFGTLNIQVTEAGSARPVAARIQVRGDADREWFVAPGEDLRELPPGTYSLEVSRGEEYALHTQEITLAAGETLPVSVSLQRLWDTEGMVSGDFHQHQSRSHDSAVASDTRVLTNMAAGVDFIAPTDHMALSDFKSIVQDLGYAADLHVLLGEEFSPAYGHINFFPMTFDHHAIAGGATEHALRVGMSRNSEPPALLDVVQQRVTAGAEIVQINHPRDTVFALFNTADYDPVVGATSADPEFWPEFNSLEVYNDPSLFCTVFRDWFSFLSRGIMVAGVGNSDTHSTESPAGFPRNYLLSATDNPGELSDTAIVDALRNLNVTVSGGILIDFENYFPGDEIVVDAGETFALATRVQTTEWSGANELIVFVNGIATTSIDLSATLPEVTEDYLDNINLQFDRDSYVVLLAWGADAMASVTPGKRPFGFTNPLFFDVGGDGWTPPGVASADDLPEITGIPFCGE